MWRGASVERLLRRMAMLVGFACVSFGLTLAISSRNGVEQELDALVAPIGSNLYRIPSWDENGVRPDQYRDGFSMDLFHELASSPGIGEIGGETIQGATRFFTGDRSLGTRKEYAASYIGVTPNYFNLHDFALSSGRRPQVGEHAVAVVKPGLVASLFGELDALGRTISLATADRVVELTIVGVLGPVPEDLFGLALADCDVFIPAEFVAELVPTDPYGVKASAGIEIMWARVDPRDPGAGLQSILSTVGDEVDVDSIRAWLGFAFTQKRRIVSLYSLSALALLFVATVNAATISLTEIAQMTHGIGVRRAVGARGVVLAIRIFGSMVMWAAIGTGFGAAAAAWIAPRMERLLNLPLNFSGLNVIALGLPLILASAAALIPAYRATRIPPLRAIRLIPLPHETHPLRGTGWLLTTSCIVGIAAVITVVALSDTLVSHIDNLFAGIDRNTLVVAAGSSPGMGAAMPDVALHAEDLQALASLSGIRGVLGESFVRRYDALYDNEIMVGRLYAIHGIGDYDWPGRLISGKLPTTQQIANGATVALIGQNVADRNMPDIQPVGETINIGNTPFTIIGVFDLPRSTLERTAGAWRILVPANSLEDSSMMALGWIRLDPTVDVETTADSIRGTLSARNANQTPPRLEGPAEEMGHQISIVNGVTYGLRRLSLLTLIVSAFGLAGLFWSQTLRRRREIGIHRSFGAPAYIIFWRVLRRALATTAFAGAIALAFGLYGVSRVSEWFFVEMSFHPTWVTWTLASVVCAAVLGGGIPAWFAAKRPPGDSMRQGRL